MKNLYLRMLTLLLAVCVLLSMAACTSHPEPTEPSEKETAPGSELSPTGHNYVGGVCTDCGDKLTSENPLTYLSLNMGESYDSIFSMTAYDQGDGTVSLDYSGAVRKVGTMDIEALNALTFALEESGLPALVGQDSYTDGEASGSLYAEYADGTALMVSFSGTLPQTFLDGYTYMDAFFDGLTSEMEIYVPQPMLQGEVNETDLAEINLILENAQLDNLDSYVIMDIPKDEYFAITVGLSSDEGIQRATGFSATMITTAYSLTLLTLEENADAASVCEDLAGSMDWRKWVCVAPSNALIATKDGMVLCLMGSDTLYSQTASAIEAAGWTTVQSLENPDMQ